MIPELVQSWLVDTLIWTGALMALVMALRAPVARFFGPGLAYALWLMPLLRMVLPPLTLPVTEAQGAGAAPLILPVLAGEPGATIAAVSPPPPSFDFTTPLVAVWLAGAAAFLLWRFASYHAMRRRVLADAVEIARIGKVRVIESAEVPAPVAFGVLDKVVALPVGFATQSDRLARNLALRHELQHHDGGDILLNMTMQPMFALHWFNPLAWLAWRALRRDQEAACDARVLSGEPACQRESYARLIAGFAAGTPPHRALPLACPVAGEKSIVHRLRSLTMTEPSRRRRLAGRTLVSVGALALPLTATITYAQMSAPTSPEPPAPPAAPVAPTAPTAPVPPLPPAPPEAVTGEHRIVMIEKDGQGDGKLYSREGERNGKHIVLKTDHPMSDDEFDRRMEQVDRDVERAARDAERASADAQLKAADAERARRDAERASADAGHKAADAQRMADNALASAEASVCKGKQQAFDFAVVTGSARDQRIERIRFCAMDKARDGLARARARIAADPQMEAAIKQQILRSMDHEIANLGKEG